MIKRAVVIGSGIAGLLAARALADCAKSVVVIDRDEPPDGFQPRRGVPQGNQLHVLQPSGLQQFTRWFPDFHSAAVAAGACLAPVDMRRTYHDGRLRVRGASFTLLTGSRPLFEGLIRDRTLALPNVTTMTARATGLSIDSGVVNGVCYEVDGVSAMEPADLVVDATGRGSRLGEWLEREGWARPKAQRLQVKVNYATALTRRNGPPEANAVLSIHTPASGSPFDTGAIAAIEGDRWIMTIAGHGDHLPARTVADFARVCRDELPPEFGRVAGSEFVGDIQTFHYAESRRLDFHRLARFPAGLIAVGDAVASFNPIYAQGMSSAALHASCLAEFLRSSPDLTRPARQFFALQRVVVDAAWQLSTSNDLARSDVTGPYPRGYRLTSRVGALIMAASQTDPVIAARFDDVASMLTHPARLAVPGTILRAVVVGRRARKHRS